MFGPAANSLAELILNVRPRNQSPDGPDVLGAFPDRRPTRTAINPPIAEGGIFPSSPPSLFTALEEEETF
jgi:hypothetical protein